MAALPLRIVENELPNPPPPPPASAADLFGYRLALLLTGDAAAAGEILHAVRASAPGEMVHYRHRERRVAWLVGKIRTLALKRRAPESSAPPGFAPAGIAALPEPARSAYALFLTLDEENVEEQADLMRMPLAAYAGALVQARQTLAPGTAFPQAPWLALHRPWGKDLKRIERAVHAAAGTPELTAQAEADCRWHEAVAQIPVPEGIGSLADLPKPGLRALVCHPAVLAIVLALAVVIGTLAHVAMNRAGDFDGKEMIEELVEQAGSGDGSEFETISPTPAGELDDWFVMKGFEGFTVPPELQNAKAVGCRIMKYEGAAIAQVALDQRNAMLFIFRVADLKVGASGDRWRIFQKDDWAVAVRTDERNGAMVMFQGDDSEMPGFLERAGK